MDAYMCPICGGPLALDGDNSAVYLVSDGDGVFDMSYLCDYCGASFPKQMADEFWEMGPKDRRRAHARMMGALVEMFENGYNNAERELEGFYATF